MRTGSRTSWSVSKATAMALVTSASSTAIAPLSSLEVTGKVCSPGATAWSESISDSGEEVSAVRSPAESDWTWSS